MLYVVVVALSNYYNAVVTLGEPVLLSVAGGGRYGLQRQWLGRTWPLCAVPKQRGLCAISYLMLLLLPMQVKILTRRAFDQDQLSASELVQLMHGLARMPRYAPNQGWLAALAKASQQQLQELTPGEHHTPAQHEALGIGGLEWGVVWRESLQARVALRHCWFFRLVG